MHDFHYQGLSGLLLIVLLIFPVRAEAQEAPPFTTDRPSQSDASTLVPAGYFQIEAGYTVAEDDSAGVTTESHAGPNLLLRYGAMDRIELRLSWDGYQWVNNDPGPAVRGAGDGQVSAKVYFWEEAGWLPETTLLAGTSLPFGKDGISSERSDPFFRFLITHSLPEGFSIGSNLGVTWKTSAAASGGKDTTADFIYTALLGYAVNPDVDAFVEFFGALPLDKGVSGSPSAEDRHGFDAGFAWRVLSAVQFDLSAGVGLNDAAVDLFVVFGISYRLPGRF
jgi:hypothetical protein